MRTAWYLIAFVSSLASAVHAQPSPPMRYLGEVGHLGEVQVHHAPFKDVPLKSVDFGIAKASAVETGVLFQGADDSGKPWRATVAVLGGIGWTDVWQADFDANSRPDLMIAATFPSNGRCLSPVTITFLMFGSQGRPVPWTIETYLPNNGGIAKPPALLRDFNHNHRAELVATECEYSDPPVAGEAWRIHGIYEAEDARWKLIHPKDVQLYSHAVRVSHQRGLSTEFLTATSSAWADFGNSNPVVAHSAVTITDVLQPEPECRHAIRLKVVDGQVRRLANDPCEIFSGNRLEMSDGRVCLGWPTVVIDNSEGREIVADPALIESKLRELAAARLPVTLVGQSNQLRCSPTQVWVNQEK